VSRLPRPSRDDHRASNASEITRTERSAKRKLGLTAQDVADLIAFLRR